MRQSIALKVEQNIRLSEDDALWLFENAELSWLGQLAHRANLRKNGKAVFYNINRHINPTNICALSCKFCAYSKKIGEPGGYAYEIDEMIVKAGEAIAQGATELHMVGGLHPRWNFQRYVDMIAAMRKAYPDVHLKAFTAVELDWMARKSRRSIAEVIAALREAGLNSFPGGGAEIFHPEVRDAICDTKVSGDQWIDTHRTAHKMGMRSNCTMLYGHIENYAHRVDHMRRLRELQDETQGFNVFIPLAFQPFQNEMGIHRYTFGSDDLRTIAVARLYLDNFKHIKSYWVMLGQDVAQLALQFGANDLDGTVLEEKISRAAGGRAGMIMTRSNLEELIRRSSRIPVERTTLYEPVRAEDAKHLVPIHDDTDEISRDLLRRIAAENPLSRHETWQLATTATLPELAHAVLNSCLPTDRSPLLSEVIVLHAADLSDGEDFAASLRSKIASLANHSLAQDFDDIALVLDLGDHEALWMKTELRQILSKIREVTPRQRVVLRGLSGLNFIAQSAGTTVTELLSELRAYNVDGLEELPSDDRLAATARWSALTAGVQVDLITIPTLRLHSTGEGPNWARFSEDLVSLRAMSLGIMRPLCIELTTRLDRGVIMPSEFMRALAITRLILGRDAVIRVPTSGIPALAPTTGLGADQQQHPVMKLISTLAGFGANGISPIPLGTLSSERIWEDLRASGCLPRFVNVRLRDVPIDSTRMQSFAALRHVPTTQDTALSQ